MPKLSPKRNSWPVLDGLELLSRGKVRDSYRLPSGYRLIVATDAVSIFDFILNATVPMKGIILTAISVFWFEMLENYGVRHHMIAYGSDIDRYLPEHLRNKPDLQSRAMVVKNLEMVDDVEFIFRNCLTGSGLKAYKETGFVCGHCLPVGFQDGDELPFLMDTPSNKAQEGHDEHVHADVIREKYPEQTYTAALAFQIMHNFAKSRGIRMVDSKFELGKDCTLADEVGTPDSSRYCSEQEWQDSRKIMVGRKMSSSLDKQFVRKWGLEMGIDKLDPLMPEDVEKVHLWDVPDIVVQRTTHIYRYIFWRLTGRTIEDYLRHEMKVKLPPSCPKNVLVLCGSDTDLPLVKSVCEKFSRDQLEIRISIASCHRNPDVIKTLGETLVGLDLVICCGGKAFALPGVIDAWMHYFIRDIPVAAVALGEPGSALLAAELSIEEIPGQSVIMDEIAGKPYVGANGLENLLHRVNNGELPPFKPRRAKEAQMNIWSNY